MIARPAAAAAITIAIASLSGCGPGRSPANRPAGARAGSAATGGSSAPTAGSMACVETPRPVALSATTPLGVAANDVLAAVGGKAAIDLKWAASSMYARYARAGTTTALTLSLAPATAAATFIDSQGGGCPSPEMGAPCVVCSPRMEIAIDAALESADGALDEDLRVTLVTFGGRGARFVIDVPAGAIRGSYLSGVTPDAGYRITGVHLEARHGLGGVPGSRRIVPGTWNGVVAATVRQSNPRAKLDIYTSHGHFPASTGP